MVVSVLSIYGLKELCSNDTFVDKDYPFFGWTSKVIWVWVWEILLNWWLCFWITWFCFKILLCFLRLPLVFLDRKDFSCYFILHSAKYWNNFWSISRSANKHWKRKCFPCQSFKLNFFMSKNYFTLKLYEVLRIGIFKVIGNLMIWS